VSRSERRHAGTAWKIRYKDVEVGLERGKPRAEVVARSVPAVKEEEWRAVAHGRCSQVVAPAIVGLVAADLRRRAAADLT
jgi:hypothetical protein